jgi:hypothetical protein
VLRKLNQLRLIFRARRAEQRLIASLLRNARGDPVRTRIIELGIEADERGLDALTARQQLVVRTFSARGIISNGGFRYFLQGDQPLAAVADGFRTLGFNEAAAACDAVTARVATQPQLTEEARRAAIVGAPPGAPEFDTEDSAIFDVDWSELEAAIGRYMRQYPRDFPGLP